MKRLPKYFYRAYRYRYYKDSDELNYITTNLNEGGVAVDLGAHKGGYLYWMQKSVKQKGKVFAFEPQVQLFHYLNDIARLMKYENVVIENMGISSMENEVSFFIPNTKKGDSPGATIEFKNDNTHYKESKIHITTLDKYFFERQIFPDLVKIDVEGHEKQVLLGGVNLLKSGNPRIIMECENRHLAEGNIFDVFDILIELNYDGYFFENKKLKSIKEFNVEIHQDIGKGRYINNFVFQKN